MSIWRASCNDWRLPFRAGRNVLIAAWETLRSSSDNSPLLRSTVNYVSTRTGPRSVRCRGFSLRRARLTIETVTTGTEYVRTELSAEAKQTFQVVALVATIFVVAIHYQSAAPKSAAIEHATANQLAQEFLVGGVARFAVPMFAFAAGFFYFFSDDGSLRTYLRKLRQRLRSVLTPYLIIGLGATLCWMAIRYVEDKPYEMTSLQIAGTWLLRPPAEQLWFLRDLMVLVVAAPLICRIVRLPNAIGLMLVGAVWLSHYQPFPIVGGWYLLHTETLFFFCLGCAAKSRLDWLERLGRVSMVTTIGFVLVWFDLIAARILLRPDFDCWYVTDYSVESLLIHKASIVAGCLSMWMVCWKLRSPFLCRLSGAAFFVYLVHEFPLRAAVVRIAGPVMDKGAWFWGMFPIVTCGCFAAAMCLNRYAPAVIAWLTGGRTPDAAAKIGSLEAQARFTKPRPRSSTPTPHPGQSSQ
ncbi:hypothetical protein Pla52o_00620 [Novipirellula galeiformis]|uniref:Acyltransferase 3 domain-containing protein n=1 Tax=Novipirellula galeiformis TaxID=2528004 RepID=A0A5C6CTZ9_9BACT|nr:hypothetical protein Pla52o_00620 [Novipirellula galeiformis]